MQTIRLCISVRQLCVDLWFSKGLARHLQIPNEVVILVGASSDLDDLQKVRRILSLDV